MNDNAITATPLCWPPGWKRTTSVGRIVGRFGSGDTNGGRDAITIGRATERLMVEMRRMGIPERDVVLSTNLKLRNDGLPYATQARPSDPGAAIYWQDGGQSRCMAIDRYDRVEQNIAALAATIEAMRSIERHGGAVVLERAFTGFTALPAPIAAGMSRPWNEVLGVDRHASQAEIEAAYKRLRSERHPDRGGSAEAFHELTQAYEDARR